jgi:hypothetical protein
LCRTRNNPNVVNRKERETVYGSLSVNISGKNKDTERDIKKMCMG